MNSYQEHPAVKEQKADPFMTPGEVARLFRVDPKTVTRWAKAGKLNSIRTPGGHSRFRRSDIMALMKGDLD